MTASMTVALAKLGATARTEHGKSAARRLRAKGQIPAVAYGKGLPAMSLAVSPKELLAVLKGERGKNSVITLSLSNAEDMVAMIRDYSYHPVTRSLEHVDFIKVKLDEPVDVDVPLVTTGKAVGVTVGGIVRQVFRTLPVRVLPDRIPVKIEVDISHLNLQEHISTRDLKLSEGVSVRLAPEQTLIAIVAPEKERAEDVAPTGAAPAAAAGTPAAKTPAAKGGAPAAKAAAPAAKDAKKK